MPTKEKMMPTMPLIQPLSGSFAAVRFPQIATPNIESQKISKDLNSRARPPSTGVKNERAMSPATEPRKDEVVASPIASAPLPLRARG